MMLTFNLDQNVKHQFCLHNRQVVFPRFLEIFFPQNMHRKKVKAYYRHLKANILGSLKWGIIFYVGLWCGNQSGWSYYHVNWKLQYCEDFFGFGDLELCGNVSTSISLSAHWKQILWILLNTITLQRKKSFKI